MTESFSKAITAIRFPLAIAIVFIHCSKQEYAYGIEYWQTMNIEKIYTFLYVLISGVLARCAVPLFFFISGFLFLEKMSPWKTEIFGNKLKKRIYTLFIPYMLWNTIAIFYVLAAKVAAMIFKGQSSATISAFFAEKGYFRLFWDCNIWGGESGPILVPLWFIRDLMVVCILAPILYYIITKLKVSSLLIFGALYIINFWPNILHGIGIQAIFFFSLGMYFSKEKITFNSSSRFIKRITWTSSFILCIISTLFFGKNTDIGLYLLRIETIIAIPAVFFFTEPKVEHKQLSLITKLSSKTFFIFASHLLIIDVCISISNAIFTHNSFVTDLVKFFISPIMTVSICFLIGTLWSKFFPKSYSIFNGLH